MYIDCNSASEWLKMLKSRYNFSKTRINDENGVIIVFYLPNFPKDNKTMLIGSFNKAKKSGVIICRREKQKWVEYDRRSPIHE